MNDQTCELCGAPMPHGNTHIAAVCTECRSSDETTPLWLCICTTQSESRTWAEVSCMEDHKDITGTVVHTEQLYLPRKVLAVYRDLTQDQPASRQFGPLLWMHLPTALTAALHPELLEPHQR